MNNVNTTERLIQEVRTRPPLWDQRNLNYHNRVVVNALWQDIADLLQVNKETVKVKWKGLRDTYRRELKKQRSNVAMNGNTDNIRDPSWTHYSSMNFLREYMGNNTNHSDIFQIQNWSTEDMVTEDGSPTEEAFSSFSTGIMDMMANRENESESGDSDDETSKNDVKNEPRSPLGDKEKQSPTRDGAAQNDDERTKNPFKTRVTKLKEHRLRSKFLRKNGKITKIYHHTNAAHRSTSQDDSDDDLYFFKSLIPYVKTLPPTRKLCLRSEIHNLVLREIMAADSNSQTVIPLEHVSVGLNA